MERYPTRNGIALPIYDIDLPDSRYGWGNERHSNNHHNEWSAKKMARLPVTQALRDLERHQYVMPIDVHTFLHDTYDPPQMPTEEQAAREVIDAYEKGERFKVYNKLCHWYDYKEIPPEVVERFMAKYAIHFCYAVAD